MLAEIRRINEVLNEVRSFKAFVQAVCDYVLVVLLLAFGGSMFASAITIGYVGGYEAATEYQRTYHDTSAQQVEEALQPVVERALHENAIVVNGEIANAV